MANYPKELVDLVNEYLTDGIISSKERQVLLKKAVALGVDADEFDLYIDAQQQKVDQIVDTAAAKKRGKTCPFCGGTVPQLTDKCPHCGETLTPEASEELQEIFDHLEEALVDFKSGKDIDKSKAVVERYVRKAKMYYENNPKVQKLLTEVQEESEKASVSAKKNARNKTIVSILTYNKKATAGIIIGLIVALIWGISTIWSAIKGTDVADDPAATIEAVNQAISSGDLSKAESYCAAYMQKHDDYDELSYIDGAHDAIIRYQTSQIQTLLKSGDLSAANEYLQNISILPGISKYGTSKVVDKYDAMFLALINAYVNEGDLDSAESLALVWRSKIGNDLSWKDSSCYVRLKAQYKKEGRDFSALKAKYDYDD